MYSVPLCSLLYSVGDNLLTGANHANFARTRMAKVTSGYLRQMSEAKMLIPVRHICLKDCTGQGIIQRKCWLCLSFYGCTIAFNL